MNTSAGNRRLRVLLTALSDSTLDPRPDFQRRLVWSNKDRVNFIRTVLDGYPFPEIYIAAGSVDSETGEGTELLVDGQQRMTTLHQYFQGSADIKLGTLVPPYKALTEEQKIAFLEYEVVVRDLGQMDIRDIKVIFQKINSTNYGLNTMEVRNARFGGAFKSFCDDLATNAFFNEYRIFSANEVRRMQDTRYCIVLVATMLSAYLNRDNGIEDFLTRYNDEFPKGEEILSRLEETFTFTKGLGLSPDSRLFKKADLFTFLVEYSKLPVEAKQDLSRTKLATALHEFYTKVESGPGSPDYKDGVSDYHQAALQASNDRGNRIKRGEVIRGLMGMSM